MSNISPGEMKQPKRIRSTNSELWSTGEPSRRRVRAQDVNNMGDCLYSLTRKDGQQLNDAGHQQRDDIQRLGRDPGVLNKTVMFATEIDEKASDGGLNVREDTEILRLGFNKRAEIGGREDDFSMGARGEDPFTIRDDTELVERGQLNPFSIREDTDVVQNGSFNVREDTELQARSKARTERLDTQRKKEVSIKSCLKQKQDRDAVIYNTFFASEADAEPEYDDDEYVTVRKDKCGWECRNPRTGASADVFNIREDTEVLHRANRHDTTSFCIREDTEVLNHPASSNRNRTVNTDVFQQQDGDSSSAGNEFAIREDTEIVAKRTGLSNKGAFCVREDTEVVDVAKSERDGVRQSNQVFMAVRQDTDVLLREANGEGFEIREDTELVPNPISKGDSVSKPKGKDDDLPVLNSKGRSQSSKSDPPRVHKRQDSVFILGPSAPKPDGDFPNNNLGQPGEMSCAAPRAHLHPTNTLSADLDLAQRKSSQKVRETSARRHLHFGDALEADFSGAELLQGVSGSGNTSPQKMGKGVSGGSALVSSSASVQPADEFTVLEDRSVQKLPEASGAVIAESFSTDLSVSDGGNENFGIRDGPGDRRGKTDASDHVLQLIDDRPEHLMKWDTSSEFDCDTRPASSASSPCKIGNVNRPSPGRSLPSSPLKGSQAGSGLRSNSIRKPPLSPSKPSRLQLASQRALSSSGGLCRPQATSRDTALQSCAATVNPFLPEFISSSLSKLGPVSKFSGVNHIHPDTLLQFVRSIAAGKEASLPNVAVDAGSSLLGSGGYATVYSAPLAIDCVAGTAEERVALKIATPAALWEFAAARAIADRIPARYSCLFMPARCIFLSEDAAQETCASEPSTSRKVLGTISKSSSPAQNSTPSISVLVMPLGSHGTLLDLINAHKMADRPIGDALIMYISLQLLLALHAMQQARIIHTDLKPDNCLLSWPSAISCGMSTFGAAPAWSAAAASLPSSRWGSGCLQVIDFGRAIDLQLMPVGTQFEGVSTTEGMQCPEMLAGKPWHYCHDAFCVAATIHAVLLGEYIKVQKVSSLVSNSSKNLFQPSTAVPATNPRRLMWEKLFHTLLNCPLAPERPDVTPLITDLTSELETSEKSHSKLWREMRSAFTITSSFLAQKQK